MSLDGRRRGDRVHPFLGILGRVHSARIGRGRPSEPAIFRLVQQSRLNLHRQSSLLLSRDLRDHPHGHEIREAEERQLHTRHRLRRVGNHRRDRRSAGRCGCLPPRPQRAGPSPYRTAWIPPLAAMFAIVAGVLVAWFLTALILSRAPEGERCPRCGSINRRGADSCGACGLPLARRPGAPGRSPRPGGR
jgi:hypothetical protein